MPLWASEIIASSSAREYGAPSAVACSSIIRPSSLMTQLRSVEAWTSSGYSRSRRGMPSIPPQLPAAPARRYTVLDARRDPHAPSAHLDQAWAVRVHVDAELDLYRPQPVHLAA